MSFAKKLRVTCLYALIALPICLLIGWLSYTTYFEIPGIGTAHLATESPTDIQLIICDEKWGPLTGYTESGAGSPPSFGGYIGLDRAYPPPKKVEYRWFNFSQQRFFYAKFTDPDMEGRYIQAIKSIPRAAKYSNALIFSIFDSGKVEVWARITPFYGSGPGDSSIIFLGRGQGHEVKGNTNDYKARTEVERSEGVIPLSPTPPDPATNPFPSQYNSTAGQE